MPMLSYTSNFEDVIINRALSNVEKGFYVDVGAYHPVACSNTCALYQKGWRGMVVEPQARLHPLWLQHRPQDTLIEAAVGDHDGEITFYELPSNDQLATTATAIVEMHQREGREVVGHSVPLYSLNTLLSTHRPQGDIHLLSIDVEGAEKAALQGLDLRRFRPWLIVLESVLPNRPVSNYAEWEPLLLNADYAFVYFDTVNRFYLAKEHIELEKHFKYPPCVWDQFVDYRLQHYQNLASKLQRDLEGLKSQLKTLSQ